jgi:hypothetical protein
MKDINHDHNLQMFHILCLIKTHIHHTLIDVHKFINSSKYSYVSIHDGHRLMMYDIHMHLDSLSVVTNNSSKYIAIIFNSSTRKAIHIVCVYKVHSFSIFTMFKKFWKYNWTIIRTLPNHYIKIFLMLNTLENNNHAKISKNY